MLGILKVGAIFAGSIYIVVSFVAWGCFWYWGMCRDSCGGVFAEGKESFKLAFSWPYILFMTYRYLSDNNLMKMGGRL